MPIENGRRKEKFETMFKIKFIPSLQIVWKFIK